jgi:hypothetical protein
MNTELLLKIVEHAEQEPRRFDMGSWYVDVSEVVMGNHDLEEVLNNDSGFAARDEEMLPPCGTIGCIAGTACILGGELTYDVKFFGGLELRSYHGPHRGWYRTAVDLLGLSDEQADRLFYKDYSEVHWPESFAAEYEANQDNPEERVKILRRRVEHFIATNGAE